MSHQYPTIKTVDELRAFMATVAGIPEVREADIIWLVCIVNARMVSDSFTIKDIAALFKDGIDRVESLADVQAFLDTLYEEDVEGNEVQNANAALNLIAWVLNFYSKWEEEAQVISLIREDDEE